MRVLFASSEIYPLAKTGGLADVSAALPRAGQVADIEIGAFLIAAGNGPEKQELLRLIGTLVRGPDATRS
jgi:starch synthase